MELTFPANTCLDEDVLKTSWRGLLSEDVLERPFVRRRLEEVFNFCLQKTSSKRRKISWWRQKYRFDHTYLRRFQDVLPWRLEGILKTSSRCLAKTSSRHVQDLFKMYHQVKLFVLTRLQDVFGRIQWIQTSSEIFRCTAKTIIYRKIYLGHTFEKFMVRVQSFQEWALWIYQNF